MIDRDEKSGVSIWIDWYNPYENKLIKEHGLAYLDEDMLEKGVKIWAKENFNIDFNCSWDIMIEFFDSMNYDWTRLDMIDSLEEVLQKLYYETDDYKKDCERFLDEYEFDNELGKYEPDDTETVDWFDGE